MINESPPIDLSSYRERVENRLELNAKKYKEIN